MSFDELVIAIDKKAQANLEEVIKLLESFKSDQAAEFAGLVEVASAKIQRSNIELFHLVEEYIGEVNKSAAQQAKISKREYEKIVGENQRVLEELKGSLFAKVELLQILI